METIKQTTGAILCHKVVVSLPDTVYAVVGDTLQLFYRGIIQAPNPYFYDILVTCAKGRQYPRYFEYTPVESDAGTTSFTIAVKDAGNNVVSQKTCNLVTIGAVREPVKAINVLCIGDSLTSGGAWCREAHRRLTQSGGIPAGLAMTNISFAGRIQGDGAGWEGNGGWSWRNYVTTGHPAYRLQVSGVVSPPALNAVYTNSGNKFKVVEINITKGVGDIRCIGHEGAPSTAGELQKSSGSGDDVLRFSSYAPDAGNPFWSAAKDQLDIKSYVDKYCHGQLDVVYFLLSWNGQTAHRTDFTAMLADAKIIFDHIHAVYPDAAIKLMGIQVPSVNGGMGANYGATGTGYADTYGMVVTALNLNRAYQDLAHTPAYIGFVEFVNISAQFDSENNMPERNVPVNTRNAKTEKRGINGVHPSKEGYDQIADVVFRNFVAKYCR
ncbi:MAG: hypothetical protein WC340_05700 [Kiritimatiellia bacterium]